MKTAPIQISAAGATVIVPARAGYVVRVYAWSLSAVPLSDAPDLFVFGLVKWQSTGGTDLTGFRALAQVGLWWDMPMTAMRIQRPDAYLETPQGEGLSLYEESAFDCGGFVCYEQVVS